MSAWWDEAAHPPLPDDMPQPTRRQDLLQVQKLEAAVAALDDTPLACGAVIAGVDSVRIPFKPALRLLEAARRSLETTDG